MRQEVFQVEIKKLIDRFDKKYYPPELVSLIFREIQFLSEEWLKKTVAVFLGQHKPALLPEFREQSKFEKDRIRLVAVPKELVPIDSMFTSDQKKFLFEITRRVATGRIPHQQMFVDEFTKVLSLAINTKDTELAHNLFQEVSEYYKIPYERGAG